MSRPQEDETYCRVWQVGMAMLDAREEFVSTTKPNEDPEEISLAEGDTERAIKVGQAPPQEIKASLVELLRKH